MTLEQITISMRCHNSIVNAIDELIPKKFISRTDFFATAIREKLERDCIKY